MAGIRRRSSEINRALRQEMYKRLADQRIRMNAEKKAAVSAAKDKCHLHLLAYKKVIHERFKKRYKHFYKDADKVITIRARKIAQKKLDYRRLATKTFDGAMVYPFLMQHAKNHNVTPIQLSYLIMICVVGELTAVQLMNYGYPQSFRTLELMVECGWLERFKRASNVTVFTPSMQGLRFFRSFRKYYHNYAHKIVKSNEYKRRPFSFEN